MIDFMETIVRNSAPSKTARRFAQTVAQTVARALVGLCLAACALSSAGCKSQDAAINLTIRGQFLIPANADTLVLDVLENKVTLIEQSYPLAPPMTLPTSVVIVQAGTSHPTVKINVILRKDTRIVGRGTIDADFVDGKTVDMAIDVFSPP